MELVSVILPVYNGEKYLKECIDSILANTYQNLEIILVDDGSADKSGSICDEYAKKDKRIKVIHQENKGLVGARNCGLSVSNGTYIAFIDADDLVSPAFYEEMVSAMETEHADLVACEYRHSKEDVVNRIAPSEKKLVSVQTFEEQLAILTCAPSIRGITWTGPFVWNKLYRKEKITVWELFFSRDIGIEIKACLYYCCILAYYFIFRIIRGSLDASIIHMIEMICATYIIGYLQFYVMANFDEEDEFSWKTVVYSLLCSFIYMVVAVFCKWYDGMFFVNAGFFAFMEFCYLSYFFIYRMKKRIDTRILNHELREFQERSKK